MNIVDSVATFLLMAVGLLLALPVLVFALQVSCALPRRRVPARAVVVRPRIAVLVPAHDESTAMLPTLKAVKGQMQPGDRCLVVADNCSDDTAAVAAQAGMEVVERFDTTLRGKGYALDYGLRVLSADPPQVVCVVDADCILEEGALGSIASLCGSSGRPVQALYLMKAHEGARRATVIAEFAWRVKNWVRPLGYLRLGAPCQLMGTGMAIPWDALRDVDLATGHLVEDMKLGIDLARHGVPPLFCPEALVSSTFPENDIGSKSQRTRWEHGHLSVIVGEVPRLVLDSVLRRDIRQLAMALDLAVPPLALLVMLAAALWVACAAAALFGASHVPLILATVVASSLFASLGLAWFRFGRDIVSLGELAGAVAYALGKMPLYVKFFVSRQVDWVRSKRDAG